MPGHDLGHALRKSKFQQDLRPYPVVFHHSDAGDHAVIVRPDVTDVVQQRGDDFLVSPASVHGLLGRLQRVLQLRHPFAVVFQVPGLPVQFEELVNNGFRV